MKLSHLLLGVAGAGLFCAGVVLARTATQPAASPVTPAHVVTAPSGRTYVAPPTISRTSTALAGELHDPDPRVRFTAVTEVDGDVALLLEASRDASAEVALRAMAELGKLYAEGKLPARELLVRARDHRLDEKVRNMALDGLGVVPTPETAALLAELLARGQAVERRASAILLMHQDATVAVPALIAALADADEYVRGNAVEALRHLARGRDFGADAAAWRAWWQSRIVAP